MTAINNLKGHVAGVRGQVLYKESLPHNMLFVVIKRYLPVKIKPDVFAFSSLFELEAAICFNELQNTGSVHYFLPARESRSVNEELRQFKTKDGFVVQEYDCGTSVFDIVEEKAVERCTEFAIEVPEQFLINLLKHA